MESLYLLIPVALVFCALAIRLLIWAIDSGQYEDLDKDAWRILAEDPPDVTVGPEDDTAANAAQSAGQPAARAGSRADQPQGTGDER